MKFKALLLSAVLPMLFASLPAAAQVKSATQQALATSLPQVLPYLEEADATAQFNTVRRGNDVVDVDAGVVRARYRIQTPTTPGGLPAEIAARTHLIEATDARGNNAYGLSTSLDELELLDVTIGKYGSHVSYQQTIDGVPVYGRYVKVNLSAAGQPTLVFNGYAPELTNRFSNNVQPALPAQDAVSQIRSMLNVDQLSTSSPKLVVYPAETPVLAWQITAWPESPAIELEVLVSAEDGSIIRVQNTSTHLRHSTPASATPAHTSHSTRSAPTFINRADGTGLVFDTDPLTTAGVPYGAPYLDASDSDVDEVNAQRLLVDLLDISQDNEGLYHLVGPHVQIVPESSGGTDIYTTPAEASPNGFQYTRENNFFEAVNVYYHIDKSQRYLQSLDIGRDIQNLSIRVNPHGLGLEDNSRYYLSQNFLAFGQGGVDDAEDAHVIWHEYGHALLNGSATGLYSGTEGQALHEGWSDYWAASYARSLAENDPTSRSDWRSLFKWDSGDGSIWQGREVVFTGKYPEDTFCDGGSFQCNIYEDGIMWAVTLMEMYDALGREATDRLALASHAYLMHPVSFRDAAEAIIQSDFDLNAGANVDFLIQLFNERGLIDSATFGPVAQHDALPNTEQLGGTVPLTVNATGVSAPIQSVTVFYSVDGGDEQSLDLAASEQGVYTGDFPLPESLSEVSYYVIIVDEFDLSARLPSSDFFTYSFFAGPDNEAPSIEHTQNASVTLIDWPAEVVATIEDNLGVDTVHVEFLVHDASGALTISDTFPLEGQGNTYRGEFPVSIDLLEPGSTVSYRILARDISMSANERLLPETDYYVFNIIIEGGLFRQYDFETQIEGLTASETWALGSPSFGLQFAHSGENLWATNLAGAYPETASQASIELPPMNLRGLPEAYLVFWHWHDTEHDGDADPDSPVSTTLWDGGNLKVSVDNGATWALITPVGGYNGTIASGRENPLDGEPAFGGYSYGWQREIVMLPVGSEVRLRFDFGSDTGNTEAAIQYAGWLIDDVSVVTELPADNTAPRATLVPQPVAVREPGQLPPTPYIELFDSTGVAAVFVDYAFQNDASLPSGSHRLSMNDTRASVFTDAFPFASSTQLTVGDILTYRFSVSDFDGNTALFPPADESPFIVEYRLMDHIDLLAEATPSGLWTQSDAGPWEVERGLEHQTFSSLVFGPLDLPDNVDNLQLNLLYELELIENHGGNIKISLDEADSWSIVRPENGYGGSLADSDLVPIGMRGQSAFIGQRPSIQQATFDLLHVKGRQIWLRADFGAQTELAAREFWRIREAALTYSTLEAVNGGFDIPRSLALHANYPDPFASTTTVGYTLPEATSVKIELYDVLGRRVASFANEEKAAGTYTFSIDGTGLSNGLYLLRLETPLGTEIERMVVTR